MPDPSQPNGRLVARLARFAMPGAAELAPWTGARPASAPAEAANAWPALDIAADTFISHERDLGRVEVIAHPGDRDWQIEKLVRSNDAGRIDAKGAWRVAGRTQQTRLDVALETKDAGAFLARFGYPDAIKGAATKIDGQLAWAGGPSEFDYPSLSGAFKIAVGPGRFTKIEPGIGKLLGVLSLQALPRRITLDFQDVFSEGFAFDDIAGNVRVKRRRDDHRRPAPRRPRSEGRHRRRRRPRARDAAADRQGPARAVDERLGGRRASFPRQPDRRRGSGRGRAARPEGDEGSDRADVQLSVHRHGQLVGADRHARRHGDRERGAAAGGAGGDAYRSDHGGRPDAGFGRRGSVCLVSRRRGTDGVGRRRRRQSRASRSR